MRLQYAGYVGEVFNDGTWTVTRGDQELERGTYTGNPADALHDVEVKIDRLVAASRRPQLVR